MARQLRRRRRPLRVVPEIGLARRELRRQAGARRVYQVHKRQLGADAVGLGQGVFEARGDRRGAGPGDRHRRHRARTRLGAGAVGATQLLRRRLAEPAHRRGPGSDGSRPGRDPAHVLELAVHRPDLCRRRLRLVGGRSGRRRRRAQRDPTAALRLRDPDLGGSRARRQRVRGRLPAARATDRGRARGVATLPRRRGGALRPRRRVLGREPGPARDSDDDLADLERAELEDVLSAGARRGRLREPARQRRRGDQGRGPERQDPARRHVRHALRGQEARR